MLQGSLEGRLGATAVEVLYTSNLEGLRGRLLESGHDADEIEDGPGPGPNRQMCVRDPDGHGHMAVELFEGSVGRDPAR
jgi:hypothetical protein